MADTKARFYDAKTLTIVTEVPLAKPVKEKDGTVRSMTKPTIKHARALGLLPSVTTILDEVLAKGQTLTDWQIDQVLDACINFPFNRDKNEEEVKAYKSMIEAKAAEYRNFTADRGKLIHALVSNWIKTKTMPDDPAALNAVGHIGKYLTNARADKLATETTLGSVKAGFAGTPDIFVTTLDGTHIVIDLKTTSFKSFTKPYDSWKFQLAAYDILTESEPGTKLVQCVIDRDIGDCLFLEHDRAEALKDGFKSLHNVWCIINNYDSRKAV